MKKRVLSMFMALALCLTLLPTAVFADVTENGEGSGGTHYVAESGGMQYETVQDTTACGGTLPTCRTRLTRTETAAQNSRCWPT